MNSICIIYQYASTRADCKVPEMTLTITSKATFINDSETLTIYPRIYIDSMIINYDSITV